MNKRLKYVGYSVVFQEVPDEVSLAINISGCPHHCDGCHSKYLWEYTGNYVTDDLRNLINQYKDLITCVCFMGGDQNLEELNECLQIVKSYNLKTCVYSGLDEFPYKDTAKNLDYIKIGHYDKVLGGLDHVSTNQKFQKLLHDDLCNAFHLIDLTYKFQKGYLNDQNSRNIR